MSEDEKMSDEELEALISDLESREGAGAPSGEEMPEEELDDFLDELEEDSGGQSTETAVEVEAESDVGPDLSELEGMDELPAETDGETEPTAPEGAAASEAAGDESSEGPSKAVGAQKGTESGSDSSGWAYAWLATKWGAFAVPILAFWWLLGAYLGQWVSAGWLIFLMSTMFVFGAPKLAYDASQRRGRYRWWLAGVALVSTVALTAPFPVTAGEVLAGYGHWPGMFLTELFGAEIGVGSVLGRLGDLIGTQLAPGIAEGAMEVELGSPPGD